MDTKNTIAAISLSAAVIIIWSLFFGPSPEEIKQNKINQEQIQQEQIIGDKNFFGAQQGRKGFTNQGWDFWDWIPAFICHPSSKN